MTEARSAPGVGDDAAADSLAALPSPLDLGASAVSGKSRPTRAALMYVPFRSRPGRSCSGAGRRAARSTLLVLALLLASSKQARAQDGAAPMADFSDYAAEILDTWSTPGLAVAVVKDGDVVYARGFGTRLLGGSEPVDEHTLFSIASTSKAFTAATLGMLVDEGVLDWDDPVEEHLPGFRLSDPWITREITIRDLLSHRSGISRSDYLWYLSEFDREEVLERARLLPAVASFRERFGYHNIMFITAGEVVESKTGMSWDAFLDQRIFTPLGMDRSTSLTAELQARDNVATPHIQLDGGVSPIAWPDFDNVGAAGAIKSSVWEMAQWIRVQLGQGATGGTRLWSEDVAREMWQPNTVVPLSASERRIRPETHLQSYGMGWYLQDYRGHLVVRHSGSLDGMRAHVLLVPELELGVVALTNLNEARIPVAVVWDVVDRYLPPREEEKNWSQILWGEAERAREASARSEAERAERRVQGTSPTLEPEAYAGRYESPVSGVLEVVAEDGKLEISYGPNYVGTLEHWHYDTWLIRWRNRGLGTDRVTFYMNPDGELDGLDFTGTGTRFRRITEGEGRR